MSPKYRVGDHIRVHIRILNGAYDDKTISKVIDNKYFYLNGGFDFIKSIDNPLEHAKAYSMIELLYRKMYNTKLGKVLYK